MIEVRRTATVKDSVDLLELLRKRGVDGDVDSLLEALRLVADAIMYAEQKNTRPGSCGQTTSSGRGGSTINLSFQLNNGKY